MDQLKDTTVRFGTTASVDFGANGDWSSIAVTFASPFGAPKPGMPKGIAQRISIVATPLRTRKMAVVVVIKNVTPNGFLLCARNLSNRAGESEFSWLAVLGVPDRTPTSYDTRLGVLQTKMLSPPQPTSWPGVWYSQPLVGIGKEAAVLLTAHNITGPSRENDPWRNAAVVGSTYPLPGTIPADDGFAVGAINAENGGRAGFYYAAFIDSQAGPNHDLPDAANLWLDHGSEHNIEDSYQYNNVTWPAPPHRGLQPGAVAGDWSYFDVYFDRPFRAPPVVLMTARDPANSPRRHHNPLALSAQNVTTHGFTVSARNTDTAGATAEFFWIAIGCEAGCG